jgi:hypothetical protein
MSEECISPPWEEIGRGTRQPSRQTHAPIVWSPERVAEPNEPIIWSPERAEPERVAEPGKLFDSAGHELIERGPEHMKSPFIIFMCYDDQFGSPVWFIFRTTRAAELCARNKANGVKPSLGSRKGVKATGTGAGYNFFPEELNAPKPTAFVPDSRFAHLAIGRRAELDIAPVLRSLGLGVDHVNGSKRPEREKRRLQWDGIDLIISHGSLTWTMPSLRLVAGSAIDVKSRESYQKFARLFIQTHESNREGIHE